MIRRETLETYFFIIAILILVLFSGAKLLHIYASASADDDTISVPFDCEKLVDASYLDLILEQTLSEDCKYMPIERVPLLYRGGRCAVTLPDHCILD